MEPLFWLSPEICLLATAILVLLWDKPGSYNKKIPYLTVGVFVAFAFWSVGFMEFAKGTSEPIHFFYLFHLNSVLFLMKGLTLLILFFVLIFTRGSKEIFSDDKLEHDAFLVLTSVSSLVFMQSSNFILLWVAFVATVLGLAVLTAFRPKSFSSSEASVKGLYSSLFGCVFMGIGVVLLYIKTGSFDFQVIRDSLAVALKDLNAQNAFFLLVVLFCLLTPTLLWISGFPLHFLALDSAEGAPTVTAAYLLHIPRIAGLTFLLKVIIGLYSQTSIETGWQLFEKMDWQPLLFFSSAVSLLVGAFGALKQTEIKRLLAYGSVYQVGLMLMGISIRTTIGISTAIYFLIISTICLMGLFFIFRKISEDSGDSSLSALDGLARTNPYLNLALAFFLLSWVGLPPFSGFFAHFYIFGAVLEQKEFALGAIALLTWIVSLAHILLLLGRCFSERTQNELKKIQFHKAEACALVFLLIPLSGLGILGDHVVRYLNLSLHVVSNFL